MGGDHSSSAHLSSMNPSQWNPVGSSNGARVLANRYNQNQLIQEYPIAVSSDKQLDLAEQLNQIRVNDAQLVSSKYLNLKKSDQMCSKSYSGNLYTQHIPLRLANIMHVPFPDVLHLYNQSFNGFQKLSRKLGNFRVNQDCIGINDNHVAKVWHSPNFAEVEPIFKTNTQNQMVHNIVQLIQSNTDANSMPRQAPSFGQFLYQDGSNVGFAEARRKLQLYANSFNNGIIPNHLYCVQNAGGAQMIRSRWDRTNSSNNTGQFGINNSSSYNNSSINRNTFVQPAQTVIPQVVNQIRTNNLSATVVPNLVGSNYMVASNPPPRIIQQPTFYRSQTFAPRARSRIQQVPRIIERPAQRSAIFLSPPAALQSNQVIVQKPVSIATRRVVTQAPLISQRQNQSYNFVAPTTVPIVNPSKAVILQEPIRRKPIEAKVLTSPPTPVINNPPTNTFISSTKNVVPPPQVIPGPSSKTIAPSPTLIVNYVIPQNQNAVVSNKNIITEVNKNAVTQNNTNQIANNAVNNVFQNQPQNNVSNTNTSLVVQRIAAQGQNQALSNNLTQGMIRNQQTSQLVQQTTTQAIGQGKTQNLANNQNNQVVAFSNNNAITNNQIVQNVVQGGQIQSITQNLVQKSTNMIQPQSQTNVAINSQTNIVSNNKIPAQNQRKPQSGISLGLAQTINKSITEAKQTPNQYNQVILAPSNQIVTVDQNKPKNRVEQQKIQQLPNPYSILAPFAPGGNMLPNASNQIVPVQNQLVAVQNQNNIVANSTPPNQLTQNQNKQISKGLTKTSSQFTTGYVPFSSQNNINNQKTQKQFVNQTLKWQFNQVNNQNVSQNVSNQVVQGNNSGNKIQQSQSTFQSQSSQPGQANQSGFNNQNWVNQTLSWQYNQNNQFSPNQQIQNNTKSPSSPQPQSTSSNQPWIQQTLNWQYQQQQQYPSPQTKYVQSPQRLTQTKNKQIELDQANSASSRYRADQSPYSPSRGSQEVNSVPLKSPPGASSNTSATFTNSNVNAGYARNQYQTNATSYQTRIDDYNQYNNNKQSGSAYSFGDDGNGYRNYFSKYSSMNQNATSNYSSMNEQSLSSANNDYSGGNQNTYTYQSKGQYRQYKNGQLTDGYRVQQSDSNQYGYSRKAQNLVTGQRKTTFSHNAALTGFENADLKQSMVQDDPYNVNWDPEILADLQANVHRN